MRLFPGLAMGLLIAGAATAQTASTKPAAKGTAKPPVVKVLPGLSAVSPEGKAILAKLRQQGDPDLAAIITQQQQVRAQLQQAVIQPTIDVDQIDQLVRQGATLQAQFQAKQNDRLIAALRALPDTDRAPFLRGVAVSSTQGARPTPTTAAPAMAR